MIALWLDIIDILFEECPYKKGKRCEQDIIESDVEIIIDGLSRVGIAEGEEHSGDGKQNAFIAKVKNHLTNSDIVPSAVNEKQSPKHLELRDRIVTSLNSIHPLLSVYSNTNISLLYH